MTVAGGVNQLLEGLRVVDLAAEPAAMTGRILADLGSCVVRPEVPGGDPFAPLRRSVLVETRSGSSHGRRAS